MTCIGAITFPTGFAHSLPNGLKPRIGMSCLGSQVKSDHVVIILHIDNLHNSIADKDHIQLNCILLNIS